MGAVRDAKSLFPIDSKFLHPSQVEATTKRTRDLLFADMTDLKSGAPAGLNSEISLATRSEEGRGNIESHKEQKIVQREPQVCNCAIMPFPVARKWAGSSYLR